MLRRQSEIFRTGLLIGDMVLAAASWLLAYQVRFHTNLPVFKGVPDPEPYLAALLLILPLWAWVFRSRGLYEPRRTGSLFSELGSVLAALVTVVVVMVAATFFVRSYFYSRGVVLLFFGFGLIATSSFRVVARKGIHALRRRGYNVGNVLVAGSGHLAEQVIDRIHNHPESGLRVVGVLGDPALRRVRGIPVVGGYEELKPVIAQTGAGQVVLALSRTEGERLEAMIDALEDEMVDVRLVPDLLHVLTLRTSVEDFDGLPMIALRQSPLVGWAAIQKRAFDIAVAGVGLVLAAPLLGLLALVVALAEGRPVLFRQQRMGLDGRVFDMLKFRSMGRDAESDGPVWSQRSDARTTRTGALLRRTGLDELPQLWNVLRGDMSLVGPRPERPVFIERFRREVPGYMLRHKVKAGLTGWAQANHWRGDTSLQERIEHDLFYIQNWSLGLDVRILLMTLWRTIRHP